jgi:flagellar biosynthesis/type III secretory pathway protein FliH
LDLLWAWKNKSRLQSPYADGNESLRPEQEGRKERKKEGMNEGRKEQRREGRNKGGKEGTKEQRREKRNEGGKERKKDSKKRRTGKPLLTDAGTFDPLKKIMQFMQIRKSCKL